MLSGANDPGGLKKGSLGRKQWEATFSRTNQRNTAQADKKILTTSTGTPFSIQATELNRSKTAQPWSGQFAKPSNRFISRDQEKI